MSGKAIKWRSYLACVQPGEVQMAAKKTEEPAALEESDQPSLEEVRAALEEARLRVKQLAKRERKGERVTGELLGDPR